MFLQPRLPQKSGAVLALLHICLRGAQHAYQTNMQQKINNPCETPPAKVKRRNEGKNEQFVPVQTLRDAAFLVVP